MAIADLAKAIWDFELIWVVNAVGWFIALNSPKVSRWSARLWKARIRRGENAAL